MFRSTLSASSRVALARVLDTFRVLCRIICVVIEMARGCVADSVTQVDDRNGQGPLKAPVVSSMSVRLFKIVFECDVFTCVTGTGSKMRGPRRISIQRSSAGFGFTLRHFIVYPPDSVQVSFPFYIFFFGLKSLN